MKQEFFHLDKNYWIKKITGKPYFQFIDFSICFQHLNNDICAGNGIFSIKMNHVCSLL
jgi:hypothetical protein